MALNVCCSVVSNSLRPHGLQHTRLPCPSSTPGACSNSCPLSRWCHATISSCHPLLLLPSVFPSIRVFSSESVLPMRWPKYWSLSISPSNEYSGLISFRIDWFSLLAVQGTLKSSPAPQFKSINLLNHAEILYRSLFDSRYQKKINKTLPMVLSKQIKALNKNGKASDPHTVQFTKEKRNSLTYK